MSAGIDIDEELRRELERIGLSEEVYRIILDLAPTRQILIGYPQDRIVKITVYEYRECE